MRHTYRDINVIASSRGRLRLRVPALYRSSQAKTEIEASLSRYDHVISALASPLTGHVLILFKEGFHLRQLFPEFELAAAKGMPAASPARTTAPWHLREAGEALAYFDSSIVTGLSESEAGRRLAGQGNRLTQHKPVSSFEILLDQFKSLPILLLGVSAGISLLTGGVAEAAAIVAVLGLNGTIGFATERRAESAIASLSELVDDIVPVRRDGRVKQVETSHIVPGDILLFSPGIRIAADVRLLEVSDMSVDESALTGESMPVVKESASLQSRAALAERSNMAYRGTAVSMGSGTGLVVGTGDSTEIGLIQALTGATERPRTPIQLQLDKLGNRLVRISCAVCVGIFGLGLLRGHQWIAMFKSAISLAIAAVPEGLPTVATTSLARGIGRMRARNVLIRRLHAVETIGAIQTICLDKTGTLTMNRMSAVAVQAVHRNIDDDAGDSPELDRLLQIGVLCNQSRLNQHVPDVPPDGSATENALIDLAQRRGAAVADVRQRYPLLSTELRAEGRNYMRTVHAIPGSPGKLVAIKGSPDEVLAKCGHYLDGDSALALDDATRDIVRQQNHAMASRQLRVLGFAFAELPLEQEAIAQAPATWVGLVGLADPLRPGVERVIKAFHDAGIRTVMLTGDQAATAFEVGRALGLNNGADLRIVNTEHIGDMAPDRLYALTEHADIFSRVSPAHKLLIVRALRHGGRVIAMTGDGINDGPALRAADIGIAMGGGTDVALSVADVALKDDRLETILDAVRQGRTISQNIRKSLHFLLSSNLSEILVVAASVALGTGQAMTPAQLLWLNLLSDVLPAIALAAEPDEDDVMRQAPRKHDQPIVGKDDLWHYAREGSVLTAGALGAYLYGVRRYGPGARASTLAFNSLVLGQLLHAVSCRSDKQPAFVGSRLKANPQLAWSIGGSVALQLIANLIPGLRRMLGIAPTSVVDGAVTLAGALLPLAINETAKTRGRHG